MYSINTLQRINGPDINEQAIVEQALQILETRARKPEHFITCPSDAEAYVRLKLAEDPDREHFLVVYLDQRHGVIAGEILFHGTIDGASVHPRNHPATGPGPERSRGDPEPQPSFRQPGSQQCRLSADQTHPGRTGLC